MKAMDLLQSFDTFSLTCTNNTQDTGKRTPPAPLKIDGRFCRNTNQGRFSDAHAAAEEARDVDPFGKSVRLLCPRLMALHSEDARSQVHHTIYNCNNMAMGLRGYGSASVPEIATSYTLYFASHLVPPFENESGICVVLSRRCKPNDFSEKRSTLSRACRPCESREHGAGTAWSAC